MPNTIINESFTEDLVQSLDIDPANWSEEIKEGIKKIKRKNIDKPIIYIGAGTCGLGAGAGETLEKIEEYLAEKNIEVDIKEVGCIGFCVEEPLVDIQMPGRTRLSFSEITEDKVDDLLDSVFDGEVPEENLLGQFQDQDLRSYEGLPYLDEHAFFKDQTRMVLPNCGIIDPESLEEYIAYGGFRGLANILRTKTPEELCDMVEESGLRGRGGGGFPTGTKWKFALNTAASQKYFVCNADEGDPGAFMDRAVIEGDPYRLLEGLTISSYAIGAFKAYIYIRAEYPLAIERLEHAIGVLKDAGLLGDNILNSGYNLEIQIKKGAGAFVCGEETALIHSIEGKRGMPRPRPPYPATKGLFNKPTVINNVETLANLPGIARKGANWFNARGTEGSKGTKVFALSGDIKHTGLVEVEMGVKLRNIIFNIGGGISQNKKYKAAQMGGPSGGCIPEQHLDIEIDYKSLQEVGAMMGSGGLVVMDEDTCMVDVAKFFMDFIQRESCGKCIPCREGTRRMLDILKAITRGAKKEKTEKHEALQRFKGVMYLERLSEVIQDSALCGLGQTAPNPVLSTLRWFRDEYEKHIYERTCPAGVCKDLIKYTIDDDKCVGCTLCAKHCPTNAIKGKPKAPHYIVSEECVRCGQCVNVCRFDAISVK
ncbi:MAG: NADH-quinone oxidoreductase subunit NuoF [Candidatus Marinimicrobia bacterium]|nr:NADH-quinone oxidoreductase subunit NuoF [Candidatus Neomarinimicrobiota bacterium]